MQWGLRDLELPGPSCRGDARPRFWGNLTPPDGMPRRSCPNELGGRRRRLHLRLPRRGHVSCIRGRLPIASKRGPVGLWRSLAPPGSLSVCDWTIRPCRRRGSVRAPGEMRARGSGRKDPLVVNLRAARSQLPPSGTSNGASGRGCQALGGDLNRPLEFDPTAPPFVARGRLRPPPDRQPQPRSLFESPCRSG